MNFSSEGFELKELQRLEGHTDRVWSLAWKPAAGRDGVPAVLASCSGDKTVRIWEQNHLTRSFQCKVILRYAHAVRSCAWSPSGQLLAVATFDGTTSILKDVGGEYSCVAAIEGNENEVKSVSWNATGKLLATGGGDKSVWIWQVLPDNEFGLLWTFQRHTQDVKMVQWHPILEDFLFSCSYDNTIKVWAGDGGYDDWYCLQTLNESNSGHTSTVWALSFNDSGDKMVSCSDDLTIKIWGTNIGKYLHGAEKVPWRHLCTLSGYHDRTIFSVHWSREGIIATGAADGAIRFFVKVENEDDSVANGPTYRLLLKKENAHDMGVNAVQWSTMENRCLASASDGTIKIWELCSTT